MRPLHIGLGRFVLPVVLLATLGGCATPQPDQARVDPAVADRAYQAGLFAEAQRVREAAALALRAPRLAYPIFVPTDLGAFVLAGATVEEDYEEVYYALRYRRPDGACFTVTGSDGWHTEEAWSRWATHDSVHVEVRALHAVTALYRAVTATSEAGPPSPGDLLSDPLDADGLEVLFSSALDAADGCRPLTLDEAAPLVAGLRPLDPADDLEGAYRPLALTRVQDHREGNDSESLAIRAFTPPGYPGTTTAETVRRTDVRAVVLVTSRAATEAASDREVRAVFVYSDGRSWRLVSAGERFRCRAGTGHRDWSPQPCE